MSNYFTKKSIIFLSIVFIILSFFTIINVYISKNSSERKESVTKEKIYLHKFNKVELKSNEHPYYTLEKEYTQQDGDGVCGNKYLDLLNTQILEDKNGQYPYLFSYDGDSVTKQNHLWYHKKGGFCVANK
jgi:hypothetical protein